MAIVNRVNMDELFDEIERHLARLDAALDAAVDSLELIGIAQKKALGKDFPDFMEKVDAARRNTRHPRE